MLPTLRQYALTTSLLRDAFFEKETKHTQPTASNPLSPPPPTLHLGKDNDALQIDINLAYTAPAPRLTFYIPHPESTSTATSQLSSVAHLLSTLLASTSTPTAPPRPPLAITLDIHANADIAVVQQNVVSSPPARPDTDVDVDVDMDAAEAAESRVKRLARALEVCGDVGVWGEWVRREVGRGGG
jgi:hypothetical protein